MSRVRVKATNGGLPITRGVKRQTRGARFDDETKALAVRRHTLEGWSLAECARAVYRATGRDCTKSAIASWVRAARERDE